MWPVNSLYAISSTIALGSTILAVGDPQEEAVFVFAKDTATQLWGFSTRIRSWNYDDGFVNVGNGLTFPSIERFGTSVVIDEQEQTLMVGAPLADSPGNTLVEVNPAPRAEQRSNLFYGHGAVYVYTR